MPLRHDPIFMAEVWTMHDPLSCAYSEHINSTKDGAVVRYCIRMMDDSW